MGQDKFKKTMGETLGMEKQEASMSWKGLEGKQIFVPISRYCKAL